MRIGFLTTSFPRREGDPAGGFVLGMAGALVALGHEIEVIAPEPDGAHEDFERPGIGVHRISYLRPRSWQRLFYGAGAPENLGSDPLALVGAIPFVARLALAARAACARWDAVVSHWAVPSGLVGGLASGGRPHLVVCHGSDVHFLSRIPGGGRLAAVVAARATNLLFVTEGLRELFLSLLPPRLAADAAGRSHVCPMGIDLPDGPLPDRSGRSGITLLFLGRLVPVKGVSQLPTVLAGLPDVRLVVAGDGPERPLLESAFAGARVDARFTGVLTGKRKEAALAEADALVHPATILSSGRTDGSPVAVLEAMARGLPIVATRAGGVPSIVRDGVDGLLVPPHDPLALRGAIDRIRTDPDLRARLGRSAALRAHEFSWPLIAPRVADLLAPI